MSEERRSYWKKQIQTRDPEEIATILAEMEARATRDQLTGLPNETEFRDRFAEFSGGAFRRGSRVFVAFLDFDDLKKINDDKGHKMGDHLLLKGVSLFKSSFRTSDLLGRKQGDEFLAALEFESINYQESIVVNLLQRVVSTLAEGGVSVSIGISEFKRGENIDDVINRADRNMQVDKKLRKAGRDFQ